MAHVVFTALSEKLASDIVILDIRTVSPVTDFFVLATAGSQRQLKVLVATVLEAVRTEADRRATHVEGLPGSGWVLADFDDVVVHILDAGRRDYYRLEELWEGAQLVARMP